MKRPRRSVSARYGAERLGLSTLVAICILTISWEGHAQAPQTGKDFYGWQTLLVHGLCLGTATGLMALPEGEERRISIPFLLGAAAITGPIVHMSHGHFDKAFVSFGLQIGSSFGGFIAAESLACGEGCSEADSLYIGYLGLGIGSLVGVVIDAGLLGWDGPMMASLRGPARATAIAPFLHVSPSRAVGGAQIAF